jgi:hypothetical protein
MSLINAIALHLACNRPGNNSLSSYIYCSQYAIGDTVVSMQIGYYIPFRERAFLRCLRNCNRTGATELLNIGKVSVRTGQSARLIDREFYQAHDKMFARH